MWSRVSERHPCPAAPLPTLWGVKTHRRAPQKSGEPGARGRAARHGLRARFGLGSFPSVSHRVHSVRRQRSAGLTSRNDRNGLEALGGEGVEMVKNKEPCGLPKLSYSLGFLPWLGFQQLLR